MRRFTSFILYIVVIGVFGIVNKSTSSEVECQLYNGQCTYNVNLNPTESCASSAKTEAFKVGPEGFKLPADEKMHKMQRNFDVVKSDHENRIKELENSIQKVLRNAIPTGPVEYTARPEHVDAHSRRANTIEVQSKSHDNSGSILLLQLQNQFNKLRTSLSERTADLLETRNKLNETADLLHAAQKLAFDSNTKLVNLETKSTVLERENRIVKNKLKDKTERLKYATETLNATETNLFQMENQLYDVVRSESTLKEELETLKYKFNKTQAVLEELQRNHTELETKYRRTRRTLRVRDEELMECYAGTWLLKHRIVITTNNLAFSIDVTMQYAS